MENIIVLIFTNEKKAIEGLHKLNELEFEGDISLFDHVLVRKNLDGAYEVLKEETTNGWRTLAGMTIGGLLGLLGGPIGVGVGLYAGTAIGAVADVHNYAFERDFMDRVKKDVPTGATAIIAEVDEDSSVFINTYMQPLAAEIIRSNIFDQYDQYVDKRVAQVNEEIESLEKKFDSAIESEKEEIRGQINELKKKRDEKIAEIKADANKTLQELKDKIDSNEKKLKDQVHKLRTRVSNELDSAKKSVIEKRIEIIESIMARYEKRLNKLNEQETQLKKAHSN